MRLDTIYAQKCAEPSDINEHMPVLRSYASQCQHVTEFGVRDVVSTWALIAGRPKKVVSYDLINPGMEALENVKYVAGEAGVEFVFHKADVLTADIEKTDLLFIDTYHVYEQLRQELGRNAEIVSKWIIMHDTETFGVKGESGSDKGLIYAINEFVLNNLNKWAIKELFANNNGLTVLERSA